MLSSSRARETAFVSNSDEVTELMNFHRVSLFWQQSARGTGLSRNERRTCVISCTCAGRAENRGLRTEHTFHPVFFSPAGGISCYRALKGTTLPASYGRPPPCRNSA